MSEKATVSSASAGALFAELKNLLSEERALLGAYHGDNPADTASFPFRATETYSALQELHERRSTCEKALEDVFVDSFKDTASCIEMATAELKKRAKIFNIPLQEGWFDFTEAADKKAVWGLFLHRDAALYDLWVSRQEKMLSVMDAS